MYDRSLGRLRDAISSSITVDSGLFITEQEIRLVSEQVGDIIGLSERLADLPVLAEKTLNVLDFDDTIHSRYPQLQLPLLQDNRGYAGNRVIDEILGREKVLEQFYNANESTQKLLRILAKQNSFHSALILTAGDSSWQRSKLGSVGIDSENINTRIVSGSKDKPMRLIKYILELGYIPGKIIIYEDRVQDFLRYGSILSKLLGGVEIVVDKVRLSEDGSREKIADIQQTIFTN